MIWNVVLIAYILAGATCAAYSWNIIRRADNLRNHPGRSLFSELVVAAFMFLLGPPIVAFAFIKSRLKKLRY